MKLSRIITSFIFLFYVFLNLLSAKESGIIIFSPSRELSFHVSTFSVPRSLPSGIAARFELSPFVFGGSVSDSYGKRSSGIFGIGAGLNNLLTQSLFLSASIKYSLYPQSYHFFTSTNQEKIQSGAEYLLNVNNFIGLSVINGYGFRLSPLAGIYGNFFIIGDATNILLGPAGGLETGVNLFDESDLKLRVVFAYDLLKESGEKPLGGFPFASLSYSIIFAIQQIFFGYSGEYLMFQRMERIDEFNNVTRFALNHRLYHSLICGYTF